MASQKLAEGAGPDVDRPGDMSGLELGGLPDIDHERPLRGAGDELGREIGRRHGVGPFDGSAGGEPGVDPAVEGAGDRLVADPIGLALEVVEIGRIVDETISVMSLLHANRGAQSDEAWAEMGMQTLHASWKEIQMELTPEQRAKWAQAMTAS